MYQHGDVLIKAKGDTLFSGQRFESIPAEAKPVDSLVLAEGEVTGHAHRVSGDARLRRLGAALFLCVGPGGATVTHEEHAEQDIGPGEYQIEIVQEYDHFAEEARNVAD